MKNIKLVLFDYDGTLVDEKVGIFTPSKYSRKAISILQQRGCLCMLATGRAYSYVPQAALDLGLDGFITCNGGMILLHDEIIFKDCLDEDEVNELIQFALDHHIQYMLEGNEYCYVLDRNHDKLKGFIDHYHMPKSRFINHDPSQKNLWIPKITFICDSSEETLCCGNLLKEKYDICYHGYPYSFDIAKNGINKGSAIEKLMKILHIEKDECMSFGDGSNDYTLLEAVKYGIAMKNHHISLDEVCFDVTDSVINEGITKAMLKYNVISKEEIEE